MRYNWPLIGNPQVQDYFARAFSGGKVHHAYLFEGPEHVGKATFARMLARTLLCETNHPTPLLEKEGKRLVPCGACRGCTAFDHGTHPDVVTLTREEDAASISIEATRDFIHSLATTALLGSVKIGMIEEAELLHGEAANVLLKTLEEPARGVVIFLISHTLLLATIASRCQRIRFGFAASGDIVKALEGDVHAEELSELASGRPGVAIAMRDDLEARVVHEKKAREMLEIFSRDEGARMLWSAAQFGKGRVVAEKRLELHEYLDIAESVLRDALLTGCGAQVRLAHEFVREEIVQYASARGAQEIGATLARVSWARHYLAANVDPQSVSDYLFLGA